MIKRMFVDAVLIAGPTAGGKSAAALALAERINGIIVNADSMQVYSELAILTARPSADDEARADHRLYGHVGVRERYSVGRYVTEAASALADAQAARRPAIFVGGTGLYFDALTKGLSPIPAVPPEVREAVRQKFAALGRDAFFAELAARDPISAARLRVSDTQRILRAADVLEATGKTISQWQELTGVFLLKGLRTARIVLAPPREVLLERIDYRFDTMMKDGALEEARALIDIDRTLPAAKALGLPQLWQAIEGQLAPEAAVNEAKIATRHYVKRQMTWFRNRMSDWTWLESQEIGNIITSICRGES